MVLAEAVVVDERVVVVVDERVVVEVDGAAEVPGPEANSRTTLTQSISPVIICNPFPPVFLIIKFPSIGKY